MGATGSTGAPGSQGIQGIQGPQGTPGTNGTNGTVIPTGLIDFIASGTCPTGWTEVTAISGFFILATKAANGDVGTTGNASLSLTAAAQTFTGNAGTVPAETFTGTPFSSVINHTHTVTTTYMVQGGTTAATTGTHVMTSTATGGSARAPASGDVVSATTANPAGGVSSITPAGTNGTAAFTPAGTNGTSAVTGTATPAFIKLIPCSKN